MSDFMREVLALAASALDQGELPIAALVVLDNRVIAAEHTRERLERRKLVHAELLALEAADRLQPFPGSRAAAILYSNLEPCMMCVGAAMVFGVDEICFALESPTDGATHLLRNLDDKGAPLPHRIPRVVQGMLREESIALFEQYVARHPTGRLSAWASSLIRRDR
jgi:tRNA(adenine34) deaminase